MGIDITSAATTANTWTLANEPNERIAFRIAVSPPVIASMPTAGASSMKCSVWFPQANVV